MLLLILLAAVLLAGIAAACAWLAWHRRRESFAPVGTTELLRAGEGDDEDEDEDDGGDAQKQATLGVAGRARRPSISAEQAAPIGLPKQPRAAHESLKVLKPSTTRFEQKRQVELLEQLDGDPRLGEKGYRVVEGNFMTVQQAIGAPRCRFDAGSAGGGATMAFLNRFVRAAVASRFIHGLIKKHGVDGKLSAAVEEEPPWHCKGPQKWEPRPASNMFG